MNTTLKQKTVELWEEIFQNILNELGKVSPLTSSFIDHIFNSTDEPRSREWAFKSEKTVMHFWINGFEPKDENESASCLNFEFEYGNRVIVEIEGDAEWDFIPFKEKTMTWQEAYDLLNSMVQHFVVLPPVVTA